MKLTASTISRLALPTASTTRFSSTTTLRASACGCGAVAIEVSWFSMRSVARPERYDSAPLPSSSSAKRAALPRHYWRRFASVATPLVRRPMRACEPVNVRRVLRPFMLRQQIQAEAALARGDAAPPG